MIVLAVLRLILVGSLWMAFVISTLSWAGDVTCDQSDGDLGQRIKNCQELIDAARKNLDGAGTKERRDALYGQINNGIAGLRNLSSRVDQLSQKTKLEDSEERFLGDYYESFIVNPKATKNYLDKLVTEETAKNRGGVGGANIWSGARSAADKAAAYAKAAAEKERKAEQAAAGTDSPPQERAKLLDEAAEDYLKAQSPKDAERVIEKSLELSDQNPQALGLRGALRFSQGDMDQALSDARASLALDPNNKLAGQIQAYIESARRPGLKGQIPKPDFGALMGTELASQGKAAAHPAADDATRAGRGSSVDPGVQFTVSGPAQPLIREAMRKFQLGDSHGALTDATRAIAADRKSAQAWTLRAKISNKLKNYPAAVSDAGEALKLDPMNVEALLERSFAQYQLGNYRQAIEDAETALRLDPRSALGYLYRAQAREKLGEVEKALEDYQTAAALDPALTPIAEEAKARLAAKSPVAPPSSPPEARRWLIRGAGGLAGLLLLVAGIGGLRGLAGRRTEPPAEPEGTQRYGTLPPGMRLGGNYRIVREVGRGGMGVVYEAFDEALQRRVAIKQLRRDLHVAQDDLDGFLREARLVAKLKHPNIAEIHAVAEQDDLYLVFDFIEGKTLSRHLAERKSLPLPEAQKILGEVAAAVEHAHRQKIIHRDLKPSNIMITPEGAAKVMDFGIAHQSKSSSRFTQTAASGTPHYMAPEQVLGQASRESDLYALGIMAYELLTGELPFPGPDFHGQKLKALFTPITHKNAALPQALDPFFAKVLSPDPVKRPMTAGDFIKAFDQASRIPAS